MTDINGKLTAHCPKCGATWHVLRRDFYGRYSEARARFCPGCGAEIERKEANAWQMSANRRAGR